MSIIAFKKSDIQLPNDKSIDNCFAYTQSVSFAFARDNKINVIYDLNTLEDYKFAIKEYNVTDKDPLILYFKSYSQHKLGRMPLIIDTIDDGDEFVTKNSVIALSDDIDGVENKEEFVKHFTNFNRKKYKDIAKLVFGDNLAIILNPDKTYEIYGLELNTTKKWHHSDSGIIYSNDDYKTEKYHYNQTYYNGGYGDDDEYSAYNGYSFYDQNANQYICCSCHKKVSSVFLKNGDPLCTNCYYK